MSRQSKMSEDEKRWRAEEDARTLERHAEIKNDPERLAGASKVIQNKLTSLNAVSKNIGANSTKKTASASKGTTKKPAGAKTTSKATTPKKTAPAKTSKPATKTAPKTAPKQQTKKRGK